MVYTAVRWMPRSRERPGLWQGSNNMATNEVLGLGTSLASKSATVEGAELRERVGRSRWARAGVLTLAGLTSRVMRTLLKEGKGTGHHSHTSAMVSGIYATPTYYAMTEQTQEAAKYQPDKFAVFYLFEDIHVGALPNLPPIVTLRVDDGRELSPLSTEVLRDSFHHRATVVRFPNSDARGRRLINEKTSSLELVAHDPASHSLQTMHWDLPIVYPKDVAAGTDLSVPTVLALLAGLLAVLSPSLLQLTVYYTFALAGVNMKQHPADAIGARAQVIRTALCFIAGFTIVFTATGSLAGLAGQKLQSSGILESSNRLLTIAAGLGVLLLGVWVGGNSGAPGLCRLPIFADCGARSKWPDAVKMMFMGSAFAVGCSTCFGGALFISLMIYVGTVGSASLGATALLLFSLGIALPYLLSAVFLSRA